MPELNGHAVQDNDDEAEVLYVLAAQAVTEPPAPVYPASATQALSAVEAVALPVPELPGQEVHDADDPDDDLYVLATQAAIDPSELK